MYGNANDGLAVVRLQAAMGEVQAAACACGEFFNNHKFGSVPMIAQSDAASTLNATMLAIISKASEQVGIFGTERDAMATLFNIAA